MTNPKSSRRYDGAAADEGRGARRGGSDIRFSAWNLLLLLPLLMLITPWYNKDSPRLFGMPFFYWYQFAFVFVGVASVAIVFAATKHIGRGSGSPPQPPVNPDAGDSEDHR